jgi:hypothetical protein
LDGYWALADLTGIPDFFSHMVPFARSLLPGKGGGRLPRLKPWVKKVFLAYIVLMVPVLALLLIFMLHRAPAFIIVMGNVFQVLGGVFTEAWASGDLATVILTVIQVLLNMVLIFGIIYLFLNLGYKAVTGLWSWGKPTLRRRAGSAAMAMGLIALLAVIWMPYGGFVSRAFGSSEPAGVQYFEITSNAHVNTPVAYLESPPVGGPHAPIWQNCGFYDTPVANENAVHSLEHGAVWITYRPDLPTDQVESLQQLASREDSLLVSPYPGLQAPVVASAWGVQLQLDSATDARLGQFIKTFRNGERAPEAGESCSGGVGTPR